MQPMKLKQNPKAIGERSEAHIIAKLSEAGYDVLRPFGNNLRYDLVIEDADGSSGEYSVKLGDRTVNIYNLRLQVSTTIRVQEELRMVVRITEVKLITSLCIVPKIRKYT